MSNGGRFGHRNASVLLDLDARAPRMLARDQRLFQRAPGAPQGVVGLALNGPG